MLHWILVFCWFRQQKYQWTARLHKSSSGKADSLSIVAVAQPRYRDLHLTISYTFPEKTDFSRSKKKFQQTKDFLYLPERLVSYTLHGKVKALHFRYVWIRLYCFLYWENLTDWSKCWSKISQSLFVRLFYFPIT